MVTLIPSASRIKKDPMAMSQSLPTVPADPYAVDDLFRKGWIDPLDSNFLSLLTDLPTLETINFSNHPITTISDHYYGAADYWYVILFHNGFLHPDEVPMGTPLRIPDIRGIQESLNKAKSRAGERVTI